VSWKFQSQFSGYSLAHFMQIGDKKGKQHTLPTIWKGGIERATEHNVS
jgi:hypothetical protein